MKLVEDDAKGRMSRKAKIERDRQKKHKTKAYDPYAYEREQREKLRKMKKVA